MKCDARERTADLDAKRWVYDARRHKRRCSRVELRYASSRPPLLIKLDCDVLALHFRAVQRFFGLDGIFFVPKFDHADIRTELSLNAHRIECTIGPEQVIELRVCVAYRQLLHEARQSGRRRRRRRWVGGWIW